MPRGPVPASSASELKARRSRPRLDEQREVERWGGVGEGADRYEVDAGGGDRGDVVEGDAPRRLERWTSIPIVRQVAEGDGLAQPLRRHVVEQQAVGAGGEGLGDVVEGAALALAREPGRGGARPPHGLADAAAQREVVLLDQDRV